MPWSTHDFPPAMRHLPPPVRRLAIRIANALLERGYSEGEAIRIAIAQARKHFAKGLDFAFLPATTPATTLTGGPSSCGPSRRW
jgi:hypothetical protein